VEAQPMLEPASKFLVDLDRGDLAALLPYSRVEFREIEYWEDGYRLTAIITSPPPFAAALAGLSSADKNRIREAIFATQEDQRVRSYSPQDAQFESSRELEYPEDEKLYPEVLLLIGQMISVATANKPVEEIDDHYRVRYRWIDAALRARGWEHENPFYDLWDWYYFWCERFPTQAAQRSHVPEAHQQARAIYKSILLKLIAVPPPPLVPKREPTGWERVDRTLEKCHQSLSTAKHSEDFQSIGLMCREVVISLGQAVYDRTRHAAEIDGVVIGDTDGARMIEAFVMNAASGEGNARLRKHAKASVDLAVELQHKRTADKRAAALCLEATASIANIVSILAGRRNRGS
jgi:hypothetical protein